MLALAIWKVNAARAEPALSPVTTAAHDEIHGRPDVATGSGNRFLRDHTALLDRTGRDAPDLPEPAVGAADPALGNGERLQLELRHHADGPDVPREGEVVGTRPCRDLGASRENDLPVGLNRDCFTLVVGTRAEVGLYRAART